MALLAIPADEGRTFFGNDDGEISPCNVYWDTATPTNLAGTVITATSTTTITGSGTAFLTDFVAGDWILINTTTPVIRQIASITTDTSLVLTEAVYTGSTKTYARYTTLSLGKTMGVSFKYTNKKADIKFDQTGDSPANRVLSGYEASLEVVVGEGTISRMEAILNGFYAERSAGSYTGYAQKFALGQLDSSIVKQMKLVKLIGTGESTDPLDTVTFFRCAPASDVEAKYDATTQRQVKSMFTIYLDDTRLIGGQPIFYSSGTVTLDT